MCVFNTNLFVFDSMSIIRYERELSFVLTCHVAAAFCTCASDVCGPKTVYQIHWTYDFNMMDMTIKT